MAYDLVKLGTSLEDLARGTPGIRIFDSNILGFDLDYALTPTDGRTYRGLTSKSLMSILAYQASVNLLLNMPDATIIPFAREEFHLFYRSLGRVKEAYDINTAAVLRGASPKSRAALTEKEQSLASIVKNTEAFNLRMQEIEESPNENPEYRRICALVQHAAMVYDGVKGKDEMVKDVPYIAAVLYYAAKLKEVTLFTLDKGLPRFVAYAYSTIIATESTPINEDNASSLVRALLHSSITVYAKSGKEDTLTKYLTIEQGNIQRRR